MARILVVDDDQSICSAFEQFLTDKGHTPVIASNVDDALASVAGQAPDLVIMDIRMPGKDGLQALEEIQRVSPAVQVVIMTAYGTSRTSIEAMRLGAYEYLVKPLDLDEMGAVIDKALAAGESSRSAKDEVPEWERYALVNLIGASAAMQEVYKLIGRVTSNDLPLIVVGESGTGKELVARTIHFNGPRKSGQFVVVRCDEFAPDRLEAEIFGSGPSAPGGRMAGARGGTLFLDHVEAVPLTVQDRLATYLSARAPDDTTLRTSEGDARVIASSTSSVGDLLRAGTLSEELRRRLGVVPIHLPPLRARREDIAELVRHFISGCNARLGTAVRAVDPLAMAALRDHTWPGNVADLEAAVTRAAVLSRWDVITRDDVAESLRAAVPGPGEVEGALRSAVREALRRRLVEHKGDSLFHDILAEVETTLVGEALAMTSGNQLRAAKLLGLSRATLRKKMPPAAR